MYYSKLSENWLSSYKDLPEQVLGKWQYLASVTEQGDPVCCAPTWNIAFQQVFHPSQRIFYLQSSDGLLLFSEYVSPANEIYLTPLEDSWLFGQPLLGKGANDLLAQAIEILFLDYGGRPPGFVLSGIREESRACMELLRRFGKDYHFFRYRNMIQSGASLEGGLDGWLSRRSANHRAKLKKAIRKGKETGIQFERRRPASIGEAREIYARMLDVELRSWKGLEKCGMAEEPSRDFYEALISRHAVNHSAYIIFARLHNRDIGFIFGGTHGRIYRGQQFSYDNEYRHLSIGNLMQYEKVRWLCEEGFERYDMGPVTGPKMAYKEHWTEEYRRIQAWIMRTK